MDLQVVKGATEIAFEFWPVTLLLASAVLASATFLARQGRPILYGALLSFSPFALTVVIAACGVVFENQGGFTSAGLVSLQGLVILLLILQVFLSVVLMWRLRRIYILVVTVQALAFWVSLGAGFLAILSVNGDSL